MLIERRVPEAGGFRRLFGELKQQFEQLFPSSERRAIRQREERAVEALVDDTDRRVRLAPGYLKRLRGGVNQLLEHVEELTRALPPPLLITPDQFAANPSLRNYFVNSSEMLEYFSYHHAIKDYLTEHRSDAAKTFFALLTMEKCEKRSFGVELQGEQLVHEVPKSHIYFTDHKLIVLQPTLEQLYSSLRQCLFDSYTAQIRAHTAEQSTLTHHNADNYLDALQGLLQDSRERVSIETDTLILDRLGVVLTAEDNPRGESIELTTLTIDNDSTRVIQLVEIVKSELLPPKDFLNEASALLQL